MSNKIKEQEQLKQKDIQKRCDEIYERIKRLHIELKHLRKICAHHKTFYGNYMVEKGRILQGQICSDCGSFIDAL